MLSFLKYDFDAGVARCFSTKSKYLDGTLYFTSAVLWCCFKITNTGHPSWHFQPMRKTFTILRNEKLLSNSRCIRGK